MARTSAGQGCIVSSRARGGGEPGGFGGFESKEEGGGFRGAVERGAHF